MINHWMFRCKDVSYLISKSMDETLPFMTRVGIWMHLVVCHMCRKYKSQLNVIGKALSIIGNDAVSEDRITPLPDHVREKLTQELKNY